MGNSDPEFQVPSCHSFFLAVDKSLAGRNLWRVAKKKLLTPMGVLALGSGPLST